MNNKRAISELNQIYGILSPEKQMAIDKAVEALELIGLPKKRPCEVCANKNEGFCCVWDCPFDKAVNNERL